VRAGQRVAILNFGALFGEAMAAGEELDATVVDMRWVKPLDEELILELAAQPRAADHPGRKCSCRWSGFGRRRAPQTTGY
jgi:hypothetical protein